MVSRKKPRDRKPSLKKPGLDPEHALFFFIILGSYGSSLGHTKHIFIPFFFRITSLSRLFSEETLGYFLLRQAWRLQPNADNYCSSLPLVVVVPSRRLQGTDPAGLAQTPPHPNAVVCKFTSLVVGANQLLARG